MRYSIVSIVLILVLLFVSGFCAGKTSAATPAGISTQPARIELKAEMSHIMADDVETIKLTAYVYDAQDNLVPDGTQVNFTIGNAMSNAYTGGFTWSINNGSFSPSPGNGTFTNVTRGGTGRTTALYGWVPKGLGGDNSTIWAYINGTNIYSNIKIYFANPMPSWTGHVIDQSGSGWGGIPVTFHAMGIDSNQTPYEVYNMTRTTGSSQPYVGQFSFDRIMLNNLYFYVDAVALSADNRTIYGRSDNFSMDRSNTSIGDIILKMPALTPTPISSPSATPTANNGMATEPIIVIMAIIIAAGGAYYLFKKK